MINFGNTRELLKANGFISAPIGADGRPLGPWAEDKQLDYSRYLSTPYAEGPAAVLTRVPMAQHDHSPVQNAQASWLAVVTVHVRADLLADVEAIIRRVAGDAKCCPARMDDEGTLQYVFRVSDAPAFGEASTGTHDGDQYARATAGPSFLLLDGEWRGGDLLSVFRSDLAELDAARAAAIVEGIDELLDRHDAPYVPPMRYVARPLPNLAAGERLEFGHKLAAHAMKENGYAACPVPWGESRPSKSFYVSASFGLTWNPDTASMGVGVFLGLNPADSSTWLSFVEISGDPELVAHADAVIVARLGAGMLRVAGDGTRLRLYRQPAWDRLASEKKYTVSPEPFVAGRSIQLRFGSAGAVVVSGTDANGNAYRWPDGSPLTVKRSALPELNGSAVDHRLRAAVGDALTAADTAPTTRRRSRA